MDDLLATMAFITSGSSWGCWQPSMSKSEKVMVVSSRGSWILFVLLRFPPI